MKLTRRKLLKLSAATSGGFLVGSQAGCATKSGATLLKSSASTEYAKVMADATTLLLESYPESATSAGVDKGERRHLKAKLSDRSIAGQAKISRDVKTMLNRLRAIDTNNLSDQQSLDLNVIRSVFENTDEGFKIPYGDVALLNSNWSYRNSPYAVAQNTGAFVEIPSFLDSSHSIDDQDSVDEYLSRMQAYAQQLDGETERVLAEAEHGVVLPDFLMAKTLGQLKSALDKPATKWGLVDSLVSRAAKLDSVGIDKIRTNALNIADTLVRPAIGRQYQALSSVAPKSTSNAGVWALPNGDEYYQWALNASTTTTLSADEVHQMGLEELAALHARMDPILRSIGYTKGSVGERMQALAKDPSYHFADGDAGRAEIMQFIEHTVEDIRSRMPQAFETLVPGFLEVTRIAPEVEAGAPGAYGGPGSVDGTKPGHFWINLRTPALHNKYSLADLTYHEAIPGHVWQGEYTFKQSLLRSLLAFNAYSEGWALYAEQIADELGVYKEFPVGQLGYLQSLAFRACRLVVDTGLHAKRWTREEANHWFVTNNGSNPEEVAGEVDRYCSWPGQACGYKVGHTTIVNLRERAKAELGNKFDFRRFNDAVVLGGSLPMTVLSNQIDGYIAREKART